VKPVSHRTIIIDFLKKVERRRQLDYLSRKISFGAMVFLLVLIFLKLWDVVSPIRPSVLTGGVLVCLVGIIVYLVWHMVRRRSLQNTAASIDSKAGLHDEMKTALWFITNPSASHWIDAQIVRAATRTRTLDVKRLYPRSISNTVYIVAGMLAVFIGLNLLPLSSSRNWRIPPVSPTLPESILADAERLLEKANALHNTSIAQQLSQIIQRIQQDSLSTSEAAALLKAFEKQLEETAERMARLDELLKLEAKQSQKDLTSAVGQLSNGSRRVSDGSADEDFNDDPVEASKLKIKLEQEKLEGVVNEDIKADDLQPSRWTLSKLNYRNIRPEIKPTPEDFLEQDRVPREYRSVVKQYFEAISSADSIGKN